MLGASHRVCTRVLLDEAAIFLAQCGLIGIDLAEGEGREEGEKMDLGCRWRLAGGLMGLIILSGAASIAPIAARAEEGSAGTSQAAQTEAPLADVFDERITALIVKKLGGRADATHSISAYYRAIGAKPLWLDEIGWRDEARAVVKVLQDAAAYGLEPSAFKLPDLEHLPVSDEEIAAAEIKLSQAVIKYARHARGGRVDLTKLSKYIDRAPVLPSPAEVLDTMARSSDLAKALLAYQPQHPQFEGLRKRLAALRAAGSEQAGIKIPPGPVLRQGMTHPQVALLRQRLDVPAGAHPTRFDAALTEAVKAFQRRKGLKADGVVGSSTRKILNGQKPEKEIVKLLINMERWRSMPEPLDDGGGIYVWANIPEFRTRIIRNGKVVFSERSIVGLLDKQTPVFSDKMEWIEFHPTWYVPNSIKREDILPSLRRPTSTIVQRYHLKIDCGAAGSDPAAIDWNKVDITRCQITQPPGPKSVLGDFKFKFPNKHAVYMHDTLTKRLFRASIRAFSHGCIRIEHPKRMAKILLAHQNIMPASRVDAILRGPRREQRAFFKKPIPVHITYLTALFDDNGKFITRPDVYGHDRRLAEALLGKGHLIDKAPVGRGTRYRPPRKPRPKPKEKHWTEEVLYN